MTNEASLTSIPLPAEKLAQLQTVTNGLSTSQIAWISGYLWGRSSGADATNQSLPNSPATEQIAEPTVITILSASQTGNARRVAEELRDDLLAAHLKVNLINTGDYKFKQIDREKIILLVTSTQGEGEPPEEAVAFYKFLFSKKAPKLTNIAFAVFGLGDITYEHFAQAGNDFDRRFEELGGERLLPRVDADVDYEEAAEAWRKEVTELLEKRVPSANAAQIAATTISPVDEVSSTPYDKESPLTATLSVNQKITGRHSDKDVRHIEIDLGDSGLRYKVGDALGVWYENDPALIRECLDLLGLTGEENIKVDDTILPLAQALQHSFELTVNNTRLVESYATLTQSKALEKIISDKAALQDYAQNTPIVDMIRQAGGKLTAEQFISLLRPLTPRLYSIASSQAEAENEVHLTVGVVRYEIDGRKRAGGASSFLADRIAENGTLRVFVEHNDNFRLPDDPNAPVIMIGPGTGVAPFRAFMQQRDNDGAKGKNWLFFGNPHFIDDFLYQIEWQAYVKQGLLTHIDLAWSRDQAKKIYVQDKLREKAAELWKWIKEDGAYLYVCGDATHMAKDVDKALIDIIREEGGMDEEAADEFLTELRLERRYQRDVY
ncbi:NADPH-dependent assimilatory sulfite reductase flavoprotein subunit [Zymomonas sp.]|uniref:NADPH-dependent assimilatory sulfite reductase flavoprotein subunit n=1 Tax=Zymomonas sp. TaxID=2068624 RepID=UPI0025EE8BBF|nr:NADPH-dependent assimilatory sulfite reductase flavoprotein subunit [Zymomonas sp.]MCA1956275.1 NADPH-dependent assimilatory sulfite reductase flavoprotein subunit [Zymomonas sp.]